MWRRFWARVRSFWSLAVLGPMATVGILVALAQAVPGQTILAVVCAGLVGVIAVIVKCWHDERRELAARVADLETIPPMSSSIRQEFRELMRLAGQVNEATLRFRVHPAAELHTQARQLTGELQDRTGMFGE